MSLVKITITGLDAIIAKYGVDAMQAATGAGMDRAMSKTADLVKEKLTSHTKTGALRGSIIYVRQSNTSGYVHPNPQSGVRYAEFVEQGTGVYGPHKSPIRPKVAKAMAWHPTSATGRPGQDKVVRRSVKGQPGVHMFERTLAEDKGKITTAFEAGFRAKLGA